MARKSFEELQAWSEFDKRFWQNRNDRFERDQNLYTLFRPGTSSAWARETSDILITNDPKTLVKKLSRILARHPNTIENAPIDAPFADIAQRIENWCYHYDRVHNFRWMADLNNPYRYDQAFYLALRGWLCERITLNAGLQPDPTDPTTLFTHQIFDPACVYPHRSGGTIRRVTHSYIAKSGQLLWDPLFSKVRGELEDLTDDTIMNVDALYWQDNSGDGGRNPSWWHAVILNNEFVKKPVELGYNPWLITITQGASYRATPWDDQDYIKDVGTGILDDNAENYAYINRVATKLNTLLSIEANPPSSIFADGTPGRKLDLTVGARNVFEKDHRVELHRPGPSQPTFQLLWDLIMQRADRGGLPRQFYGESAETGINQTIAMSAGKDVLWPFTEGLNRADEGRYALMLRIYRDFGPGSPLVTRMAPDKLGMAARAEITAQDLYLQGIYVEVSRQDMTPQELIAKVNAAAMLVREGIISMKTARGKDWVGIQNPSKENLDILAEKVYMNDLVVQQLVPLALSETGQQLLMSLLSMTQTGMPMNSSPLSPNGSPSSLTQPATGLPTEALPPALQTGNMGATLNRDPEEVNALVNLLTGGASGGGGFGGFPPPAGSTPIRPLPQGRTF